MNEYGYPLQPNSQRTLRNLVVHTTRNVLLAIIYLLLSGVGAMLQMRRANTHEPPLQPDTFHPKRILVIRLDLIGDLVMSLTLVGALKRTYPDAEIDLLAIPSSAKIVTADSDITAILTTDPNIWRRPEALLHLSNWLALLALVRRMHSRHYDLAVSVFGPWAAIFALLSGAKRRLGFGQEGYYGFMTDSVAGRHWNAHDHRHEVDYCLELAQAAGATVTPEDRIPHLDVDPQARHDVERLLEQEGVPHDAVIITCHVSSHNGYAKRWPVPYWAALIDRLMREEHAVVILTGAPNDQPLIEQVLQRTHEHPLNFAGKTSLPQLAALLQRANLMITGDSGPMHIAAAVGTPLIAIHGPTDPALSGPVSPTATVLRSDIWCSPCYQAKGPADCRFHTAQCMKNVTPNQVFAVVQEKLHFVDDASRQEASHEH